MSVRIEGNDSTSWNGFVVEDESGQLLAAVYSRKSKGAVIESLRYQIEPWIAGDRQASKDRALVEIQEVVL